jgi:hypothetical protein
MIVGLRSDSKHPSSFLSSEFISTWQKIFTRLPLHQKELFKISSMTSKERKKETKIQRDKERQRYKEPKLEERDEQKEMSRKR